MRNFRFILLLTLSVGFAVVLKGLLGLSLGDLWFDIISNFQGYVTGGIAAVWLYWPDKPAKEAAA